MSGRQTVKAARVRLVRLESPRYWSFETRAVTRPTAKWHTHRSAAVRSGAFGAQR